MMPPPTELRRFRRTAVPFLLIGLAIYAALYAGAEHLVERYGERNRFFVVHSAPSASYDHVILGSSHAAVFDYRDLNERLEAMTGTRILNLAIEGAGVTVNRFVLDYFLTRHEVRSVVYVLDSFGFYARAWNEERLQDAGLFLRAPFDPALVRLLLRNASTRGVAVDYLTGFSKINNPDRFAPDRFDDEGARFERVYRPVAQIDRQRIAYLYPDAVNTDSLDDNRYVAQLEALIRFAHARNIRVALVRPPVPARVYRMLPREGRFDAAIATLAARLGAAHHDFSSVHNDESLFFDTDHLNLAGALTFFENHLQHVLAAVPERRRNEADGRE